MQQAKSAAVWMKMYGPAEIDDVSAVAPTRATNEMMKAAIQNLRAYHLSLWKQIMNERR